MDMQYLPCSFGSSNTCTYVHMQCISLLQFDGPKSLHIAALTGKVDILRLLITECGCKADLEDEVGSHLSMMCLSRL